MFNYETKKNNVLRYTIVLAMILTFLFSMLSQAFAQEVLTISLVEDQIKSKENLIEIKNDLTVVNDEQSDFLDIVPAVFIVKENFFDDIQFSLTKEGKIDDKRVNKINTLFRSSTNFSSKKVSSKMFNDSYKLNSLVNRVNVGFYNSSSNITIVDVKTIDFSRDLKTTSEKPQKTKRNDFVNDWFLGVHRIAPSISGETIFCTETNNLKVGYLFSNVDKLLDTWSTRYTLTF